MPREYAAHPGVPGLAIGTLLRVDRPPTGVAATGLPVELAFEQVSADLGDLAARLRADGQQEPAEIAEAVRLIAEDPDLRGAVELAVAAGTPVLEAVHGATERYATLLAELPDPVVAGRAADVRAVGRRLLAVLSGTPLPVTSEGLAGVVLVGHEVAADDLLSRGGVVAVGSVVGGAGAHTAIVARALGVPAVFGMDPAVLELPDGAWLLVDGASGRLVLDPAEAERTQVSERVRAAAQRRAQLAGQRELPTGTRDGYPVAVYANVSSAADNSAARELRAAGIGLVRTEMPFLQAEHWPAPAEHVAALTPLLAGFAGRPVTVRTLDFAADKLPPFLRERRGEDRRGEDRRGEDERGLALLLAEPAAFAAQLRAIVQVGGVTQLRVLIPMVASLGELVACRELLDGVLDGAQRPALGAMIELPAAVAAVDALAGTADFFSIGSNDLTAALLGLSRRDPALTPQRAAEPVVLQAIATVAAAARRAGIPVSVCGDAAAEPALLPLLIGLGCDALSVAPAALDETRALVRALDHTHCVAAARRAVAAVSLDEALALGTACLT